MRALLPVVFAATLNGCCTAATATPTTPEPPPATPASGAAQASPEAGTAPTPFTAEQIRDATPAGRRYRFREEAEGEPAHETLIEFVAVDADGCTIRHTRLGADGQPAAPPEEGRSTWEDLRRHALFPASDTAITDDTIEVPAGRFPARVYTVTRRVAGHTAVQRYWFAPSLPGAPVRVTHERDGTVIMSMTLVEHHAP